MSKMKDNTITQRPMCTFVLEKSLKSSGWSNGVTGMEIDINGNIIVDPEKLCRIIENIFDIKYSISEKNISFVEYIKIAKEYKILKYESDNYTVFLAVSLARKIGFDELEDAIIKNTFIKTIWEGCYMSDPQGFSNFGKALDNY